MYGTCIFWIYPTGEHFEQMRSITEFKMKVVGVQYASERVEVAIPLESVGVRRGGYK